MLRASLIRVAVGLLGLTAAGCGYTDVRTQCPGCSVFARGVPPASLPEGTRTAFVLVPGLLGFGWEWDEPVTALRAVPDAAVRVFDWSPRSSLTRVASDLADGVTRLLRSAPPSLEQVVVVGHSAGGLATAWGAALVRVPLGRRVLVVNVGAPYAGLHREMAETGADFVHGPFALALGGDLRHYPAPAPRVRVESYGTGWPGDPVMEPIGGHHPDDPGVGPPGPRRVAAPGTDHNKYLAIVVREVIERLRRRPW